MEKGFEHTNSEIAQIDKPKKAVFSEIFGVAKDRVKEAVGKFLAETQTNQNPQLIDFERAVENLKDSEEISAAAGEFYKNLIPKALRKPKKEYVEKDAAGRQNISQIKSDLLSIAKTLAAYYPDQVKTLLKKAWVGFSGQESEPLTEEKSGEVLMQKVARFFKQDGEVNIIREQVLNKLAKDANFAGAQLQVQNKNNGLEIDLSHLLPDGFNFVPAKMFHYEEVLDRQEKKIKTTFMPVNLKDYRGTAGAKEEFFMVGVFNIIAYGDLTKKGGFLRLLHEISHAWQEVYGLTSAQKKFEKFYHDVGLNLNMLSWIQNELSANERKKAEFSKEYLDKLRMMGVEIIEDRTLDKSALPKAGEAKIKDEVCGSFVVKDDKIERLLTNYEKEERDAWAHAILVLRFLRKRGIDLEPQLKNINDFQEVVNGALGSYQESVEKRIEFSERKVRFTNNKTK
ncbi:MAG: hypothetical protein COU85_01825 [Candidatus Portnoybacteria bacterium CG10_big_fil_rev_8_21_14_0_10_44_7]|uniref:Uncharacterized protein n=1 Tax=Candidatus Portnoybacteria bacterium CG10_big_fil_rev_8_21_14_0_10_44_7 TaxID=1974816 RepID=A0A2M8KIP0_9BACT|nr:MAG: hypothetical protein COU85_01825 [Candidatus Portnoybacteria bacterium CG10_big_fil_rev_8_21_14_0_10_44_7]